MAKLTLSDLYGISFTSLGTAVADWKDMVGRLDTLANSARDHMLATSNKARWSGENAGVTRDFVKKTAEEFRDAHAEAKSIWNILEDAHTELAKIQSDVKNAVDVNAKDLGIRVQDNGDGTVRCFFPHVRGDTDERTQQQLDEMRALESRVNGLIAHAEEIDDSAARALRKSHGNDVNDFGHSTYDSLDDAQQERASELAKKSLRLYKEGKELPEEELAELAQTIKYNASDPDFATAFYRDLGQEGALRFQAQLSLDGSAEGGRQLELARTIQDGMGVALSKATPRLGDEWTAELMRVGRSNISLDMVGNQVEPRGYQVLGTLLRHGKYDTEFLKRVGNDMIAFEREDPGAWPRLDGRYTGMPNFGLNLDKDGGGGFDPITGLLEAYGHNPDASTEFLRATVPGKQDGVPTMTNLEYLMGMGADGKGEGARQWIPDVAAPWAQEGDDKVFGKDALGHALEAAVTGLPYDHGPSGEHPKHTPERSEIMESVVTAVAAKPDLMHDRMADSLGRMAGEYMPEINSSLRQSNNFAGLYGSSNFDALATTEFLDTLGRNPDAYAEATLGAENYSASLMSDVVKHPDQYSGTPGENLKHISYGTGTVEGILGGARHDEIVTGGQLSDEEYNKKIQERADMFNSVFGSTVGFATERVPIAGEVINGVTEHIVGKVAEGAERNTAAETAHEAGVSSFDARKNALEQANAGVIIAGTPKGEDSLTLHRDVDTNTGEGYDHGKELQREAKDHYKRNPPE
ncbi:DUF6571 family protein [Streptomyces sp. NPDC002668]|uniref:DUF6571 family protein n=1 Tax=Streptomyces sp. NPDC002668 TaxID=3154422 RepID=UPI00332F1D7E